MNPSTKSRRVFGVLAQIGGIVLILLELNRYHRGGDVAWFWIFVALVAVALGLFDLMAPRDQHRG